MHQPAAMIRLTTEVCAPFFKEISGQASCVAVECGIVRLKMYKYDKKYTHL